ncbi:hypothetical protein HC891_00845 [Candidatus Gracilibacteria bacterium]|nr:hypothetical protein [Candidatus Gracilibacteria bacterium]
MRGYRYTATNQLPERDLHDLADLLAMQFHSSFGPRVYKLQRGDVAELLDPYIDDLHNEDQRAVVWLVWSLFQDALDMETSGRY